LTPLALFDLDGTLLADDTQLLLCNFVLRRHPLRRLFLPFAAAFVPAGLFRVLEARELKRIFLSYLWLMPEARVESYAREFAENVVHPLVYPELQAEIERHRHDGRILVLNSASPEFYVREIGRSLGFHHSFGTRVVLGTRQPLVAEIDGENNKLEAKIPRLEAAGLLPCDPANSWAYSDSTADLPMLRLVTNAVCINPGSRLLAHAERHHWPILRPRRPWSTRAGHALAILRQLLGAWPEDR
jgi:HAD superfamily hydrolase (TIGR01490 family)